MKSAVFTGVLLLTACATTAPPLTPAPTPTAANLDDEPLRPVEVVPIPGGPADPVAAPPPPRELRQIAWRKLNVATVEAAARAWLTIAPTSDDWSELLASAPDDPVLIARLAEGLLHGGNFACAAFRRDLRNCARIDLGIEDLPAGLALPDPCLRRELALWALPWLDVAAARREALLRPLLANPAYDDELRLAAAAAASDLPDDARLRLAVAARDHAGVVADLLDGASQATLMTAATAHHLDVAVEAVAVEVVPEIFVRAVTDQALTAATRAHAADQLATLQDDNGALPANARRALTAALRDRSPAVVARAKDALGASAPRTRADRGNAQDVVFALATEANRDEPGFARWLAPGGVRVTIESLDRTAAEDLDNDGDPTRDVTSDVILADDVGSMMLEAWLAELRTLTFQTAPPGAVSRDVVCTGLSCEFTRPGIRMVLTVRKQADGLVLTDVARHEDAQAAPACDLP